MKEKECVGNPGGSSSCQHACVFVSVCESVKYNSVIKIEITVSKTLNLLAASSSSSRSNKIWKKCQVVCFVVVITKPKVVTLL